MDDFGMQHVDLRILNVCIASAGDRYDTGKPELY
jgi:hypothetical protein